MKPTLVNYKPHSSMFRGHSSKNTFTYQTNFTIDAKQTYFFSLKIVWAPVVDALYIAWIGRRKTWIVPCQYLMGALFFIASYSMPSILASISADHSGSGITMLAVILFFLNLLAATQDVAVDGWALTMLSRYAEYCKKLVNIAKRFLL